MDRTRLRLGGLVIAHIAAHFALEQIDSDKIVSASLFFSQVGLLGIWLAVGQWTWPKRLGTFLAGTAIFFWWEWHWQTFEFLWIGLGELVVAAGLIVARFGPAKLQLVRLSEPVLPSARFQFSLRQVMALVVVVAVMLTGAKAIRAFVSTSYIVDEDGEAWDYDAIETIETLVSATSYLGCVVVSWAATWAILGIGGVWARSTVVVVVALALGSLDMYCFAHYVGEQFGENWYYFTFDSTVLVGQSLFTMVSLMVVRSCGFRLIGRKGMAT
jgi:hypothetical protein